MALHKTYRKDKATAWLAAAPNIEVECAHFDPKSPEWLNAITRNTRAVSKLIEHRALSPEQDRRYAIQTFVEVVCKGWRTVAEDGAVRPEIELTEGEWLPFTPENAVKTFATYPAFYNDVVEMARDLSNYQLTDTARKN